MKRKKYPVTKIKHCQFGKNVYENGLETFGPTSVFMALIPHVFFLNAGILNNIKKEKGCVIIEPIIELTATFLMTCI